MCIGTEAKKNPDQITLKVSHCIHCCKNYYMSQNIKTSIWNLRNKLPKKNVNLIKIISNLNNKNSQLISKTSLTLTTHQYT